LKFKAEVTLLLIAITLFALSMFCYTYADTTTTTAATTGAEVKSFTTGTFYPFRSIALVFVGIASISMVTASISYSKKTKPLTPLNP